MPVPAAAASAAGHAATAAAAVAALDFLDRIVARAFKRAGLGRWSLAGGCAEPLIPFRIERVPPAAGRGGEAAAAQQRSRRFADGALGCARLYPASVGSFDAIARAAEAAVASERKSAAAATPSEATTKP